MAENDSNTLRVDAKIFVSAKKYLGKKKFPDTCGHGLSETFLCCLWKAAFIHIWIQEPDQKAEENFPVDMMRPSLKLFFEGLKKTLCRVQVYLREETLQPLNTSCSNQNAEKRS